MRAAQGNRYAFDSSAPPAHTQTSRQDGRASTEISRWLGYTASVWAPSGCCCSEKARSAPLSSTKHTRPRSTGSVFTKPGTPITFHPSDRTEEDIFVHCQNPSEPEQTPGRKDVLFIQVLHLVQTALGLGSCSASCSMRAASRTVRSASKVDKDIQESHRYGKNLNNSNNYSQQLIHSSAV